MYANTVNDFRRKTLDLPPVGRFADLMVRSDGSPVPMLNCYSPQVVPVPDDYPPHVHVTGYWFLDHDPNWQPDPALLAFLDAGPAPIYIGFGSVSARNARKRTQHVLDAARVTGQRVVFASGWAALDTADFPANVFALKSVPHDWLFPRMKAVAHHGGAGTTAAGLRAGKPAIICPFLGDQPFWGKRVYDLGVGPQPIPQGKITAECWAEAITQVAQDAGMQQRAAELGVKIRAEAGIGCAVNVIADLLGVLV
jgi:sterol 3beta-glucosyltransferase